MTEEQTTLWAKVRDFELDDPRSSYTFSDRLGRENGWPPLYTLNVISEYKRFIFLICIAPHPLTPSEQVDQVWHLHLLYTQSYWIDLCRNTLNKQVHHGPTKGGDTEQKKYRDWYEDTKKFYALTFGEPPPEDVWPDSDKRFRDIHFKRINVRQNWIIPKPSFLS